MCVCCCPARGAVAWESNLVCQRRMIFSSVVNVILSVYAAVAVLNVISSVYAAVQLERCLAVQDSSLPATFLSHAVRDSRPQDLSWPYTQPFTCTIRRWCHWAHA